MSTATFAAEMVSDPVLRRHDGGERAFIGRQLAVIREMVASLETLTMPGQKYVVRKVADLLREQVWRALPRVSARNQDALREMGQRLKTESERLLPDVRAFGAHADTLITLLVTIR